MTNQPQLDQLQAWTRTLPLAQRLELKSYEDLVNRQGHRMLWALYGVLALLGIGALVEAALGVSPPYTVALMGWSVGIYGFLLLWLAMVAGNGSHRRFLIRYWVQCGSPELPPSGLLKGRERRRWVDERVHAHQAPSQA